MDFVKGSKYWRSFTYGEDTLVGSIAAVRGKAFDAYYIKNITPHLSASLRYTYIKYDHAGSDGFFGVMMDPDVADDYTGSNAFFGDYGTPIDVEDTPTAIKNAMDIRAYIKYSF